MSRWVRISYDCAPLTAWRRLLPRFSRSTRATRACHVIRDALGPWTISRHHISLFPSKPSTETDMNHHHTLSHPLTIAASNQDTRRHAAMGGTRGSPPGVRSTLPRRLLPFACTCSKDQLAPSSHEPTTGHAKHAAHLAILLRLEAPPSAPAGRQPGFRHSLHHDGTMRASRGIATETGTQEPK